MNDNNKGNNNCYEYQELLNILFDDSLCSSWLDYKIMLERFEVLDFNKILIKLLKKSNEFKQKFISQLTDQDDDVVDLFEKHEYPVQ